MKRAIRSRNGGEEKLLRVEEPKKPLRGIKNAKISICPHISEFKDQGGREALGTAERYLHAVRYGVIPATSIPCCFLCNTTFGRLMVCLHCVYIACLNEGCKMILDHFRRTGHIFAVDKEHHQIYCSLCKDFVYDLECEAIIWRERNNALSTLRRLKNYIPPYAWQYQEWIPSKEDMELIKVHSSPFPVNECTDPECEMWESDNSSLSSGSLIGLRGLMNLGNTCFMNCILQAFVHNPLMRNYFLSNSHNRNICARKGQCFGCEIDLIFSESFSGLKSPHIPSTLLYSMWNYSKELAGYEQQDAHEFFISALNGLHAHCGGQPSTCKCIVHRIFSGALRSDVTCVRCKNTSTAFDPIFDISVDVPSETNPDNANNADDSDNENVASCTLADCLLRFTSPEQLESEERFKCEKCNSYQVSTKQLSISKLPLVLCFHLKRFEQRVPHKRASHKIDTHVAFKEHLDMAPFTSPAIVYKRNNETAVDASKQRRGKGVRQNIQREDMDTLSHLEEIESGAWPPPDIVPPQDYELFSVVNHHGKLDNGHYTCFVRHRLGASASDSKAMWVKCDDACITKSNSSTVLRSQGYLLFYIRKHLDYQNMDTIHVE